MLNSSLSDSALSHTSLGSVCPWIPVKNWIRLVTMDLFFIKSFQMRYATEPFQAPQLAVLVLVCAVDILCYFCFCLYTFTNYDISCYTDTNYLLFALRQRLK